MELISMNAESFDSLLMNLNALAEEAEKLCRSADYAMEKWMDNQDVCELLDISKKTLQMYRDKGKLPYSKIEQKIYYKPADVMAFLEATRDNK